MKPSRPGALAVRAVNQYRRRDVLAYLSLRYYLDNTAAQPDEWAKRVATDLVLTRSNLPYFQSEHFKEIASNGQMVHRTMFIPGANEALAESALLDECAKHPRSFGNLDFRCGRRTNEKRRPVSPRNRMPPRGIECRSTSYYAGISIR